MSSMAVPETALHGSLPWPAPTREGTSLGPGAWGRGPADSGRDWPTLDSCSETGGRDPRRI